MTDKITPAFIHLKTHSEYSIKDGLLRIGQLINRVAEYQMPAVAITDFVNLFALVKFYRKATASGIKPIIGADVVVRQAAEFSQVTLLCQNKQGYQHLTQLLSRAYVEGQHKDLPVIEWDWLAEKSEGLLVLSGARFGDVGQALLDDNMALAKTHIERWLATFSDRFYIELQRTGRAQEELYLHAAVTLAQAYQVPVVATNDVRFLEQEDFEAHEARVCIHSSHILNDAKRPHLYSEQQYFRSQEEMQQLFKDIPEALQNTVEIAKRCNVTLDLGNVYLPQFPVPEGVTLEQYIEQQSKNYLADYLHSKPEKTPEQIKEYHQRLQIELDVINKMGFPGYFLIVADFINWAKEQTIPVGPGRGSGAGSLVAFVLGITMLDPIEHELLFERFLNPERVSMPDFDIDFCMEGRDRVIEYVAMRYGKEAVSQIITYGTMAAKAVVRDVGRVLGMSYGYVDKIAKLIPFELGITLDKALEQEEALARLYQNEEEVTILIDLARKLEGITRNAGKHAGGVVIAPTKLTDFAPLYCEAGGANLVTQFDKDDVEAVGLVKFDFLGLRTLTIINWALKTINEKRQQEGLDLINIDCIPLADKKVYELLKRCETTAVFQLESRGMKELIKRLRPDTFDEITALVALFRPGPLQSGMVDDFIDRKHGRSPVHYAHPDLEPILKATYGVILYQEQVMQIAQVLAGYSLGGADILRRAMGKKKPEEMAKQREVFTKGSVERGIDEKVAEYIFDLMEKFAGYGFNKSHSAAYALISYQTAWLKTHYPAEFMAAVLSSDMDNTDKVVGFLAECESMQLKVLPPNINVGNYHFTVNAKGEIEYGLGAIKGAGEAAVLHIVEEREKQGEYHNLFDFCGRLDLHKVNRRVLEPLVRSGAMDVFKQHRAAIMASMDKAIKLAEQKNHNQAVGQGDLFGESMVVSTEQDQESYIQVKKWKPKILLQGEKESLGFYLSGHPLQEYEKEMENFTTALIGKLNKWEKKTATIAGQLISIRAIQTKRGRRMGVIVLEDRSGKIEITLFSQLFDEVSATLEKEKIYVVKGKIEDDDYTGGVRMVAESLDSLNQVRERLIKRLVINVLDQQQVNELLTVLPATIKPHCGGQCPVVIAYQGGKAKAELLLGQDWKIKPSGELLEALYELCPEERVCVEYV